MKKIFIARILIGLVAAWNLQAAFVFFIWPSYAAAGYELSGAAGEAAVRGVAVLFTMWTVPHLAALWDPTRFRLALALAVIMQFIGLLGETYILTTLTLEHATLRESILRFIAFDGTGLILLVLAFFIARNESKM